MLGGRVPPPRLSTGKFLAIDREKCGKGKSLKNGKGKEENKEKCEKNEKGNHEKEKCKGKRTERS